MKTETQVQDKFDLKVELLLEKLKADLSQLRQRYSNSVDDPQF